MIKARRASAAGREQAEGELMAGKRLQLAQMLPEAPAKPRFGSLLADEEVATALEGMERWLAAYLHNRSKAEAQTRKAKLRPQKQAA